MLVIEGRAEKVKKLQELMNEWDLKKTLFIDTQNGLHCLENKDIELISANSSCLGDVIKLLKREIGNKRLNYHRIIFYINEHRSIIPKLREFEQQMGLDCVVTIQNNDLNNIEVYMV